VRDLFLKMRRNSQTRRYATLSMLLVPTVVSFGIAYSNYLQCAFGIYLKYQALVDTYYEQELQKNQRALEVLPPKTQPQL